MTTFSIFFSFIVCISCCLATGIPSFLHFNEDSIVDITEWKERLYTLQKAVVLHYDPKFTNFMYEGSGNENVVLKYRQLFEEYVSLFERNYKNEDEEYTNRFQIFMESLQRQHFLNKREASMNGTASYGINKFSDWTPTEFRKGLLKNQESDAPFRPFYAASRKTLQPCAYYAEPYPRKVDWRKKVTRVKDQGSCGSCWAFVGSEQVESYWAIRTGQLVERSPQQLLSCSPSLGCEGGNTCAALEWLRKMNMVLASEKEYPYEEKDTACRAVNSSRYGPLIEAVCGCRSMVGDESTMLRVLHQKGPMSVNVDAVQWHDYTGGIIQHHCTDRNMNHAVQLVGYNLDSSPVPYWVVKNQWGASFGENGYVRIRYGKNMCGIAKEPAFISVH